MTAICVAGGTGQVGREVVRLALEAGHHVTVISRHRPPENSPAHHYGARYFTADVTTGDGLALPLRDTDVVIDCLEGRFGKALRYFADGGARLLDAASEAGVRRAVALSIINCDQSSLRFYRSKAAKERVYAESRMRTVVVRSTQFHSLLESVFATGSKLRLIPVIKGYRFQTISPSDVATALLEAAVEPPGPQLHRVRTIGGPEVRTMLDLALRWRRATAAKGRILELSLPRAVGRYLQEGRNLIPEERFGTESFEAWLAKRTDSL